MAKKKARKRVSRKKTVRRKKATRKTAVKKKPTARLSRTKAARKPRKPVLAKADTVELQAELERRAAIGSKLAIEREQLAQKLEALDAEIAELGAVSIARTGSRSTRRRRNGGKRNLAQAWQKVLSRKIMSVSDAANAVRRNGYRSTRANFRLIVNQALIKKNKLFKKVARVEHAAR